MKEEKKMTKNMFDRAKKKMFDVHNVVKCSC